MELDPYFGVAAPTILSSCALGHLQLYPISILLLTNGKLGMEVFSKPAAIDGRCEEMSSHLLTASLVLRVEQVCGDD